MYILRQVQLSADGVGIFCGLAFVACIVLLRQWWCFTCPAKQLLAFYGLCLMAYASVSLAIHPFLSSATCDAFNEEDLRAPMIVLFSWLQSSASIMLLTLQAP